MTIVKNNKGELLTPELMRQAYIKMANQTGKPTLRFEYEARAWARAFGWDEEEFLKELGYEKPIYAWPLSLALANFVERNKK